MSTRETRKLIVALWALAGCDAQEPPALAGEATSPYIGTPHALAPTPPNLTLPPLNTGEPNANGAFSTFVQLNSQPVALSTGHVGTPLAPWCDMVAGDAYTTPPALARQLDLSFAQLALESDHSNDFVEALATATTWLPVQTHEPATQQRLIGYQPERARWLSHQQQGIEGGPVPPPPALAELRGRGARLYCAARNAAARQRQEPNSRIMGKKYLVDLNLGPLPIRLMQVEPTLTISEPMRLDSGTSDGAQAFVLPFVPGIRTKPISWLPGFAETQLPVAFMFADSEVVTPFDSPQGVHTEITTATHVTAVQSTSYTSNLESPSITLFTVGPVAVNASFGIEAGMTGCSEEDGHLSCLQNPAMQVGRLIERVQADPSAPLVPLGPPGRGVRLTGRENGWTMDEARAPQTGDHNDAPWNLEYQRWLASVPDSGLLPFTMTLPNPLAARMVQNNDKSFSVVTKYGLTLNLTAQAGLKFPENAQQGDWFIQFTAAARGRLIVPVSLVTRFREQLEVEARVGRPPSLPYEEFTPELGLQAVPQTALTVTPGRKAEPLIFEFSGGIDIGFHGPSWMPTLVWHVPLFKAPINRSQPGPTEYWSERHRVRLTTMQSYMGQIEPNVQSHLPGGAPYPTFADRGGCDAPQPSSPPPPPRCVSEPPVGGPPAVFICAILPVRELGPDSQNDPELACSQALMPWFRMGVSREQTYLGVPMVARGVNTPQEMNEFMTQLERCGQEFRRVGADPARVATFIGQKMCDATATLIPDGVTFENNDSGPLPNTESAPCTP